MPQKSADKTAGPTKIKAGHLARRLWSADWRRIQNSATTIAIKTAGIRTCIA
jgi:hypothetical protein